MPEIAVTEGDKGRSFQARIGDSIVVRLPETPTTGFRWNAMLSDARVIEAQSDDYAPWRFCTGKRRSSNVSVSRQGGGCSHPEFSSRPVVGTRNPRG